MRDEIRKPWEVRRRKAITRLVEACEQDEVILGACDAVAVAHLATLIEWEGGVRTEWEDKRDRALDRLIAVCKQIEGNDDDLEDVEELNVALNTFVIAHVAWSLAWDNGPVEWDELEKPLEKRQRTS